MIRLVYESCNSGTAPTASHYLGHLESGWQVIWIGEGGLGVM